MMKKTLILGVVTLGGYLVKRHLDKRLADDNYLYSGYVDAALGEGVSFLANGAMNGCNKFLEATERWIDEPAFGDSVYESANNAILALRTKQCPHLGKSRLCPTLFRAEQFGLAKVSRLKNIVEMDIFAPRLNSDKAKEDEYYDLQRDMDKLSDFINEVYALESSCFAVQKILANLVDKISALGDFGKSLELLKCYLVYDEKYDLSVYDENANPKEISKCVEQIRATLEQKSAWIDNICEAHKGDSNKGDSGESSESVGESNGESESPELDSRESSGKSIESLPAQTKSEIVELVEIIKAIHALITGDFVSESKWQNDKLIEAQNVLNMLKSHPSESSAKQS